MIKFFRKIRQRLLAENKTSRYTLYALGEIFLVVVGILIALQINNWNERRKARNYEAKLLIELKNTIVSDYKLVARAIKGNERAQSAGHIIVAHLENELPYHDSLNIHFEDVHLRWQLNLSKYAFENAKSYGLQFIKDDSIRLLLTTLYEKNDSFSKIRDSGRILYTQNTVVPILVELFESARSYDKNKPGIIPNDYEALKNNKKYRSILRTAIGYRIDDNNLIRRNLLVMKDLEQRVQKELDTK